MICEKCGKQNLKPLDPKLDEFLDFVLETNKSLDLVYKEKINPRIFISTQDYFKTKEELRYFLIENNLLS